MTSSPFFDNICTLPQPTDIFAQALHPTLPLLTVALASGHVQCYRLPSTSTTEDQHISPPPSLNSFSFGANGSQNGNGNGSSKSLGNGNGHSSHRTDNQTHSILSQRRRSSAASENGLGSIDTIWKTRRHKGSARTICYAPDGRACYSGGTDGLIKMFDVETGRVVSKIALPEDEDEDGEVDAPTVVHALTPLNLVVSTDSGRLYLYDVRVPTSQGQSKSKSGKAKTASQSADSGGGGPSISVRPVQTHRPHGDEHVNALVPIPAGDTSTSGFAKQFVTVGGSTLAVTDLRKGVIATSDDQEAELSSVTIVSGLKKGGTSVGEKVLVGQSDGVISLWERGVWGDLDERIVVDRIDYGGSIDSLCEVSSGFLPKMGKLKMGEKVVAAGLDDGRVRFVRIGRNTVVNEWDLKHDEVDGCVAIDFDKDGERMITAGGQTVKLWTRASAATEVPSLINGAGKRKLESDSDEDSEEDNVDSGEEGAMDGGQDSDSEDESEEEERSGKRRKRKRNKGKDKSGGKALNFSGIL